MLFLRAVIPFKWATEEEEEEEEDEEEEEKDEEEETLTDEPSRGEAEGQGIEEIKR